MRIVVASNLANGIGLERDYVLLRDYLEYLGHEVSGQQFDKPSNGEKYDLCIWLETISEHLIELAPRHWYFANPEWLRPENVRPIQRYCERVFAKTREAERVLRERFSNVHYVGFLTTDKGDSSIPRERKALHIGGNSGMRGTNAVIEAWRSYRYWNPSELPPVTVVSNSIETAPFEDTPGIKFIKRATDEEIKHLQNSHLFHIYPSATEGFGHALHEAQSVGAVILTTQAPPMSELKAPFEVKPSGTKKVNMGTLYEVSPLEIRETIARVCEQPSHVIARMQTEARSRFEKGNKEFRELFAPHLETRKPTITVTECEPIKYFYTGDDRPLRVAFLGNFQPPHSTENDLLWTLRDMGHTITTFQENEEVGISPCADLLLWVHTHGWGNEEDCTEMLRQYKELHIPTASFHLDRYWGLNQNDQREDKIGTHPFWKSDFVFTADGGNQSRFHERGINHFWLPPGICRRDCSLGERVDSLSVDVGFVGAENYHPEWSFRTQLIDFLRAVYGDRFRVFNGYRGKDLNDLYASIKVVGGDSCFAGADYYWSDRVPETLGRGGFLIHPETKGLRIPGLVTFEPGNLQELQDKIDYYLANVEERLACVKVAAAWVKENETYTNRMTELLKVCGL